MDIKVLGTGCANCRKLEEVAREAAALAGACDSSRRVRSSQAVASRTLGSSSMM